MAVRYKVISRFYCPETGGYVDPGQPCPEAMTEETAKRLVAARCLVVDNSPPPPPASKPVVLEKLKLAELLQLAEERKVEVPEGATRAQVIEALRAAEAPPE